MWNDYLAVRQETRELTRDFFLIHDISLEVYKLLKTTLRPPALCIEIYDHKKTDCPHSTVRSIEDSVLASKNVYNGKANIDSSMFCDTSKKKIFIS